MSNTHKHKDQGKFRNKILKADEVCESTKQMWDRHNSDFGEDKERQLQIKEKIAEKEMIQEIKTEKCTLYTPTTDTSERCLICGELKYEHKDK